MTQKQSQDQREFSQLTNWLFAIPLLCLAVTISIYSRTAGEPDKQFILGAIISFILSFLIGIYAVFRKKKSRSNTAVFILYFFFLTLGQGLIVYQFLNKKEEFKFVRKEVELFDIYEFLASDTTLDVKVKTAVVFAAGDLEPEVSNIQNDKEISAYSLDNVEYSWLTDYLNIMVKSGKTEGKRINFSDVKSADTIKDLIELVEQAIKP